MSRIGQSLKKKDIYYNAAHHQRVHTDHHQVEFSAVKKNKDSVPARSLVKLMATNQREVRKKCQYKKTKEIYQIDFLEKQQLRPPLRHLCSGISWARLKKKNQVPLNL